MKFLLVAPYYVKWHYSRGLREWTRNVLGFLLFELHFFSIGRLILTLFAPFQRLKEEYSGNGMEIQAFLSVLVVNVLMRLVGAVVRSVIIAIGIVAIVLSSIIALVLLALWVVLPLALICAVIGSFVLYIIPYL